MTGSASNQGESASSSNGRIADYTDMWRRSIVDEPYERGCQGKILPPSSPRGGGCGDLHPAQSEIWRGFVRDVVLTDQGNRRCLLDGFITRWFDAFGPEATQANRGWL